MAVLTMLHTCCRLRCLHSSCASCSSSHSWQACRAQLNAWLPASSSGLGQALQQQTCASRLSKVAGHSHSLHDHMHHCGDAFNSDARLGLCFRVHACRH